MHHYINTQFVEGFFSDEVQALFTSQHCTDCEKEVSEFQWDTLTQKILVLVCFVFLNGMVTDTLEEDTINNMIHFC